MTLRNLVTDVEGILVGNAHDEKVDSGTTAIIFENRSVASYHVMGGAPGSRDTDLLQPENTVSQIDGLFLSGGSAFGLDAGTGIQAALREKGIGLEVFDQIIPLVPGAILFDLANGGNKDWGKYPPYRELGYQAAQNAAKNFELGSSGAGFGALVAGLRGGLGSASTCLENGITIGALVAVNAIGSPVVANTAHFWAAMHEVGNEFGGRGSPVPLPVRADELILKYHARITPGTNTTIGVIATDAALSKAEAKRLAVSAHDGFARALWPAHTPMDGDLIFAVATGTRPAPADMAEWTQMCAVAGSTMARAVARGIYEADNNKNDQFPSWKKKFNL